MTITIETPPAPNPGNTGTFADSKCGRCIGMCCRYFALEIDTPDEPGDFENLRWYMLHDRVQIFVDDGDWYLQIYSKCSLLGDDHMCSDYEHRPQICRDFSDESCDYDGPQGDHVFRNIAELEAYREKWVTDYEATERRQEARRKKRKGKKKRR